MYSSCFVNIWSIYRCNNVLCWNPAYILPHSPMQYFEGTFGCMNETNASPFSKESSLISDIVGMEL